MCIGGLGCITGEYLEVSGVSRKLTAEHGAGKIVISTQNLMLLLEWKEKFWNC